MGLGFNRQAGHFTLNGAPVEITPSEFEKMNSFRWFHEIPLSSQVRTKAHHSPLTLGLPKLFHIDDFDFKGKSVLDIGVADGFYSFWTEAHGAAKNVGLDDMTQNPGGNRTVDFLREKFGSQLEYVNMSVYDLSPKVLGGFDCVLFFGVLYHLIHPMLGIEKACSVCKSDFFLETHYVIPDTDLPICLLYPDAEYFNDYTNWSAPSLTWLTKALEIQGFKTLSVQRVGTERVAIHAKRVRNRHTESPVLNPHRDTTFFGLGEKVE